MEENKVDQIINYISQKIEKIKEKLAKYESPMMQDMTKDSQHLQLEYLRLSSELQANEDNLMAILNFASDTNGKTQSNGVGTGKQKGDAKKRKTGASEKNKDHPGVDTE